MIEVQLVNSVAPFVLRNRLSEVMKKETQDKTHHQRLCHGRKISSLFKEARHPHTNMAKAALKHANTYRCR
jgi:hypothetical protein